jgi:polar amino acid transport system substrate-binding protein
MRTLARTAAAVLGMASLLLGLPACTNTETPPAAAGGPSASTDAAAGLGAGGDAAAQAVQADPAVVALVPEEVAQRGMLRLVTDPTYAPFDFTDEEGRIIGLEPDMALAVANKMGLEMEIAKGDFNGILAGLAAGRYDASWAAFSITPERQQEVDLVSYLHGGTSVMVERDNPEGIETVTDLCGKTVAAQTGTTQALNVLPQFDQQCEAEGLEGVTELVLPQQDNVNQAVATGRADAMAADNALIAYYAQVQPDAFSMVESILVEPSLAGVAIGKDTQLAEAFHAALVSLQEDGAYQTILEAWNLGSAAVDAPAINPAEQAR